MGLNYDTEPGVYTYRQTSLGKSASGVVSPGAQSERSASEQRHAGGADRQAGDHGGHLIAHSMGGRNDAVNLDAQDANVNQKDQASVERNVKTLSVSHENTVSIQVSNFNSVGERPDATMITAGVRSDETGEVDQASVSFQNASHELQESWSSASIAADPQIDPSQNAGMTQEERELADELCGAEDAVDASLGSGWTYTEWGSGFDEGFLEGEADATIGGSETSGEEAAPGINGEEEGSGAQSGGTGTADGLSDSADGPSGSGEGEDDGMSL